MVICLGLYNREHKVAQRKIDIGVGSCQVEMINGAQKMYADKNDDVQ